MVKRYKNTFRKRVLDTIETMPGTIVLRKDISSLGSPRQVSRALNTLIEDGNLVRLGSGIYAKARSSEYVDTPVIQSGFTNACIETLNKLKVNWEPSQAIKDYNEGKTQQVPARFEVRLKSRFRRKIAYGSRQLITEGNIYAR